MERDKINSSESGTTSQHLQSPPASSMNNPLPHSKALPLALGGALLLSIGFCVGYFLGTRYTQPPLFATNQVVSFPTQIPVSSSPIPTNTEVVLQDISTWKTYTDTHNTYSFKYPAEWYDQFTVDKPCSGCGGYPSGLKIEVLPNSDNRTARDFAEKDVAETNKVMNPPHAKILPKPAYFSDVDAAIANGFPGAGFPGLNAYIVKDSLLYTLAFDSVDDTTAHTILSTFTFTK